MSQINLPVTKSLGLEAAMMCMVDMGYTRLQAAKWLRAIHWDQTIFGPPAKFNGDAGPTADIECHFEIGFYGTCLIVVTVHLEKTGKDGTTWKVRSAKAFQGHFPERGECVWVFDQSLDLLEIVNRDTGRLAEIFEIELETFQVQRGRS